MESAPLTRSPDADRRINRVKAGYARAVVVLARRVCRCGLMRFEHFLINYTV